MNKVWTVGIKEIKMINRFAKKHKKCNETTIIVTTSQRSGIGTTTLAKCPVCQAEEDVTDYKTW